MSSSIVNIQPTLIGKNATKIELSLQYIFNATDATVMVYLKDDNGTVLQTSAVYLPPEIYSSWSNDEPIITYILGQLNLTALEN
ncbi:MAG: hypothetical protein RL377_10 [Bacteroidota bacterium]|jgi:hypothetical protein